ncbi:MAG: preprotein translocase subunit SecE [Desulfobacteraceae bacterium]|nr:preprotein translocase subunit SecE [Desulfobacteraceae bacterium]
MARLQKKKSPADKIKTKVQEPESSPEGNEIKGTEKREGSTSQVSKQTGKVREKLGKSGSSAVVTPGEQNFYQKSVQFLREVRVELKKVTWPNRKQTAGSTVVVIILVFILAAFLGLVDFSLSKLVQVVLA